MGFFNRKNKHGGEDDDSTEYADGIRVRTVPGSSSHLYHGYAGQAIEYNMSREEAYEWIKKQVPNSSDAGIKKAIEEMFDRYNK